jgi:cobalt-zinc-cadmium efflux system protein
MTGMHDHRHHEGRMTGAADRRLLGLSLALLLAFMVAEVVFGIVAESLALLADAGHMLTDAAALGLALLAASLATRPAGGRWTFGFGRVEILAAQANGITLLLFGAWIVYEAIRRLIHPLEVDAGIVGIVALVGILVNLAVVALLSRAQRQSLNVRGAYLHIVTDLAAFVGTGLAAAVILLTGWNRVDPVASLFVAALMFAAAWSLLRESGRIFLEGAPESAPPADVGPAIATHSGVVETHDLHVWTVTDGFPALSAHVLVQPGADCHRIRLELETMLHDRFGIDHTTLQVEHVGSARGLEISRSGPRGDLLA